jgi:hypothetical protein
VRALAGPSGSTPPLSTDTSGTQGMYTAGFCDAGFRTFYPGARLVYSLSLGDTTPLGGALTVTTCGHTVNNTVLYVGTGCPSWDRPFGCLIGNDDTPNCGSNALASTLTVTATQRTYFIQLGGANGRTITSGLQWAYAAPSSNSGTASRTRSRSLSAKGTRSASGSRSRSRSRSRKPK